ncbi:MAG: hypothetical protein FJ096_08550 [Deltaproteobacteria bacterium]|nr:hypothetical protein [Deltaproteobacteria bacterium]
MTTDTNGPRMAADEGFTRLASLIRDEWPMVDADALAATEGVDERVVELVAQRTEHTRTLVRRQLDELKRLAAKPERRSWLPDDADVFVRRLGERAATLARDLQGQALREATRHVEKNPLTSLLAALGLGLLIGMLLGGGRRGRRD